MPKSQYYIYIVSVLNREIFCFENRPISFKEFRKIYPTKNKMLNISESPRLKTLLLTFIFNSFVSKFLKENKINKEKSINKNDFKDYLNTHGMFSLKNNFQIFF